MTTTTTEPVAPATTSQRGVLVPRAGWDEVVRHVAWLTHTPAEEILSSSRRRDVVQARNLLCWLANRYLDMGYKEIVERLGRLASGHSTAVAASQRQQKALDYTQRELYQAAEAWLLKLKAENPDRLAQDYHQPAPGPGVLTTTAADATEPAPAEGAN